MARYTTQQQQVLTPEQQSLKKMILSALENAKTKNIRADLLVDLVHTAVRESLFTSVPSGTCVAQQGIEWPYFSVVIAGEIQVKTASSKRVRGYLTPGDWFGNLKRHRAPATLEATEDTLLAVFFLHNDNTILLCDA